MGDPFIGDLTKAFRNVSVSRKRALQVIGGAMAAALATRLPQAAEAGKRRKPPLAFVAATLKSVGGNSVGEDRHFSWEFQSLVSDPEGGAFGRTGTAIVKVGTSTDRTRAQIVAAVRNDAASVLNDVPADRIHVVLL